MIKTLPHSLTDSLLWSDELGIGYHPRPAMSYADEYWEKYLGYDATDLGTQLTAARVAMVRRHWDGELVDVGIGGGRFVLEADCFGYDINRQAIGWLMEQNRYCNPYQGTWAVSCWDSLEHIADPEALLAKVSRWLFVSMPIFCDAAHCLASKHYRPGEHIWYFTHDGFVQWCKRQGFELVEVNVKESMLGREDIVSYAFRRVNS